MKKLMLLLLLGLFACNNNDETIISNLKQQHYTDSIQLKECDGLNNTLCKDNQKLSCDTMDLRYYIDSLEYTYTRKHNEFYRSLLWRERMIKVSEYQEKINKLQIEMDSIANL